MSRLDRESVMRGDPGGMWRRIAEWPDQWSRQRQALEQSGWPTLAADDFDQVLLGGLGGSAIAGDLAYGVVGDDLPRPFRVVRDYLWPGSVGERSLCLLSSYSGNTEETLSLYREARSRGARCLALTSGGRLAEWAERDDVPRLTLPPGLPPRAALGYSLVSVLALFAALGTPGAAAAWQEAESLLTAGNRRYSPDVPEGENSAKEWAQALAGKLVVVIAPTRPLAGVGLRWKGQINENAKQPAYVADLPEMNHNEIVAWEGAARLGLPAIAVFLRDRDEHPRIDRRVQWTRQSLEKDGFAVREAVSTGESRLARLLSLVQLGDWISLYLSILEGADPMRLDRIDTLKEQMGEFS
jgi:glucose/mannose-6-phosphate isomerase